MVRCHRRVSMCCWRVSWGCRRLWWRCTRATWSTTKRVLRGGEMFGKRLGGGRGGENIGALLRGTKKEYVERGQVLAKPGSITPHRNFTAQVYILPKEGGGRPTPFFTNYHPQFYFR